jgi:tetratricopeptide (TPR) repeat protein
MTAVLCSNLHPFIDGELDEAASAAFRQHLGGCATCPAEFEAAVLADAVAEGNLIVGVTGATVEAPDARAAGSVGGTHGLGSAPRFTRRSRWIWAVPGTLTLAAAAALLLWMRAPNDGGGALAMLVEDSHRTVDARLAYPGYPGLDRHRPLRRARDRGALAQSSQAWLAGREQALARLEKERDQHGLAVASLLEGRPDEAETHLTKVPESAAVLSDAAAVAIERGDAVRAQTLAKRALTNEPRHPQSLWNLAVALQLQGAHAEAAAAFAAVAALGEAGWAEEARQRAAALTPSPR